MKYDFTSIMDRMGKDAIAVEALGQNPMAPKPPKEGFDVIPMWVADMNFPTVPTIPEAIIERAKHPAYGYFSTRKEYLDSIIKWHETRNDVTGLTPECIGYENGVLGGVITALNVYCSKGDNVLLHKPTYIGFTNSLTNNGYHIDVYKRQISTPFMPAMKYGLSVIGIPFPLTCKRPALEVTENQKQIVDGMLKEIISKIQK